jgi:predicted RNA binding protein YcfA (HicA-like mRNA interferase family)
MKSVSGRELARLIEHRDWVLLRVQGSHHIYGKTGSAVRLTIPMHDNQALFDGLQHHIMVMAGLSEADL